MDLSDESFSPVSVSTILNAPGFPNFLADTWDEQDSETVDDYDVYDIFDELPEDMEPSGTTLLGELTFDTTLIEDEDPDEFDED
jgi:hypothetical protein